MLAGKRRGAGAGGPGAGVRLTHVLVSKSKPQTSFSTLAAPDGVPAKITMRFSTGSKTADALRRPDGMGPEAGVRLIHVWACASVMVDRATRVDRATVRRMGRPPKPRVQCDT